MTDTFDSDKFSNFTVTITDSDDTQRYKAEMYYSNPLNIELHTKIVLNCCADVKSA